MCMTALCRVPVRDWTLYMAAAIIMTITNNLSHSGPLSKKHYDPGFQYPRAWLPLIPNEESRQLFSHITAQL